MHRKPQFEKYVAENFDRIIHGNWHSKIC